MHADTHLHAVDTCLQAADTHAYMHADTHAYMHADTHAYIHTDLHMLTCYRHIDLSLVHNEKMDTCPVADMLEKFIGTHYKS